jgi:hypothetical protein
MSRMREPKISLSVAIKVVRIHNKLCNIALVCIIQLQLELGRAIFTSFRPHGAITSVRGESK